MSSKVSKAFRSDFSRSDLNDIEIELSLHGVAIHYSILARMIIDRYNTHATPAKVLATLKRGVQTGSVIKIRPGVYQIAR